MACCKICPSSEACIVAKNAYPLHASVMPDESDNPSLVSVSQSSTCKARVVLSHLYYRSLAEVFPIMVPC